VTTDETRRLLAAAARNNADWCASVCRSHGIPTAVGPRAWCSARRTPPYYPDAVTLHPHAVPSDFLPAIDGTAPGCSVKDSFDAVDLAPYGFAELFTAQWIHRPAGTPTAAAQALRTRQVSTPARLRDWQAAWHGGDAAPDVFRPALLGDPSVRVLAFSGHGEGLRGGAVLNRTAEVVGVSNLFAVDDRDINAVWASAITAAADLFPGLSLVGYEHGDDLAPALATGFATLGPLRVWVRGA
jgi:hypothetical protein